jgi:hypothetical protein
MVSFTVAIAVTSTAAPAPISSSVVSLDGPGWRIATDPKNIGRDQHWWEAPTAGAKPTQTPSIIQDAFPGYHGVAWYWRDFTAPANPHAQGRYVLRFWQVDYMADVWVNGVHVGQHEGGEDPFTFDVTDVLRPGAANRVAIRVLNPTHEPIDGIRLTQTPRRNKAYPPTPGCDYNYGGITDAVELLVAPMIRVEDLFVRPDPKTGRIRIEAHLRNAGRQSVKGNVLFTVAPATSGETLNRIAVDRNLPPGDTLVKTDLVVQNPKLWQLSDPFLYRVSALAGVESSNSVDEQSTRCGFRDFRFENGTFQLNGKRLFLKCSHSGCELPSPRVAVDPDMLRKDIINCKTMGFNSIRFISGIPPRYQLELCDEIGLMVYEECFAGWCLEDSPKMAERFDHATAAMVRRDRNHPSIVMWGVLNETTDGPVFRHAVGSLPLVRALDDSRVVMLNSGRFDNANGGVEIWSNAGRTDPCVNRNGTNQTIEALGIRWTPGRLVFHPGEKGEYAVVRWTAPESGPSDVNVAFSNASATATTDVHVLHNGRALFDGFINLNNAGPESRFHKTVNVQKGDTIDCVVGYGNKSHGADSTGLEFVVKLGDATFDAAKSFSLKSNPNGPWTYGQLPSAERPNAGAFAAFAHAQGVIGSISNPGMSQWQDILAEGHPYQATPHSAAVIRNLRTVGNGRNPYFLSEHGTGSAVDLLRLARHFEQWQKTYCDDAVYYREQLARFTNDWNAWKLADTFANPEDYFRQCLAWMANERKLDINAIRANPNVIGYSLTGTQDQGLSGEGLTTLFRELKPGTLDAMFDAWYPLRWCLFVEPVQVYRGRKAHFEAVLANEDTLAPGSYPVRIQVVGPKNVSVFDRTITVQVPDPNGKPQAKFTLSAFADDIQIDGPSGKYRFLATFQKGAAAAGGDIEFYVADPLDMPKVESEVVLWGDDPDLAKWLAANGIKTRPFANAQTVREVILVGNAPVQGGAKAFAELARHIARGASVVFLNCDVFKKDDNPVQWLPLANKGTRIGFNVWLYHKDDWAKNHPIFEGLPTGTILDATFYREIIPNNGFVGQDVPAEIVAGAIHTACGYNSGLTLGVYKLGEGRFTLNTLRIRENLGGDPVAERLLRNMLRHAAQDLSKPLADLPADFDAQLKAIGY